MFRIIVLGNGHREGVIPAADQLLPFLRAHAEIVLVDLFQQTPLTGVEADLVLVLGGDGAILRAARQMGYHQKPVLGINLGRLGFLADLSCEELLTSFPRVVRGDYRITEHLMFECLIQHPRAEVPSPPLLGLNEIAVQTGPPFSMLHLDLLVNGENVTRYNGDGLIISTAVGSTAHSLSAGGPILGQELQAFVITPICVHSLTARPVVDSANNYYTISLHRASPGTYAVIDGQEAIPVSVGATLTVRRAPVTFKLARAAGRSFYRTLHDKLRWGQPPSYRPEPDSPAVRREQN